MEKSLATVVYDLIGVGCGPSNLALAIALEAQAESQSNLASLFLDKQQDYRWHGNTMTSQSDLQISFLKDLVSLRDPTSPYSFVNYLQQHGRLADFINLGTFYPSRMEFNDYLRWVARHFTDQCRYGEEVLSVEPLLTGDKVTTVRVLSSDANGQESVREARSVVVGAGGTPRIPELFRPYKNDKRIFHHSYYLQKMAAQPCAEGKPMRIAIVGGGQSAAEAFIDLNDNYPSVQAEMIVRSMALKPADSSPFVNEIFDPASTDLVFQHAQPERDRLLQDYHHTNYSVVDAPMIDQIYGILYRQKVSGTARHAYRGCSTIDNIHVTEQQIELLIRDSKNGELSTHAYDAVILATGYERQQHRQLLAPLAEYLGNFEVDRDYRVQADERCQVPVYLQGYCESSHGLSDTLLSVLAIRSGEVAASLYASLAEQHCQAEALQQESQLEMVEPG